MLVESRFPWRRAAAELWQITLVIIAYTMIFTLIDYRYHLEEFHIPLGFATLPGAFVGVLLAFRTNSSYGRWWEARKLWGAIVNDSRSWARELLAFVDNDVDDTDDTVRRMVHRQIAWCYALTRALRKEPQTADLSGLVGGDELQRLGSHSNVPNALLLHQARELRRLRDADRIDQWQFVALEQTLMKLTDSMGGCERIRNTPFPPHYTIWIHYLIYLFIVMLPFTFVDAPPVMIIALTVPIAVGYLVVEKVAIYLEVPFCRPMTGTPMSALSRTIEINLRQMLDEPETPPALEPVNGILL